MRTFNTNCMFHILMKVGKKKVVVLLLNLRYIQLLQIWYHNLHNRVPIATLTLALVLLVSAVCILVLQVNWVVQCLVVQGGRVVQHPTPRHSVQIHYTGIHPVRYVCDRMVSTSFYFSQLKSLIFYIRHLTELYNTKKNLNFLMNVVCKSCILSMLCSFMK